MKFKNILTSALSIMLLGSVMASCSSGNKPEQTEPAGENTTETVTQAPEPSSPVTSSWVSAIFGGGPFVTGGDKVKEDIKKSGFNTLMIWSIHIHENGDLVINDIPAVKEGEFVINTKKVKPVWKDIIGEDSSIERIELSIGAWGCADFENIRTIMNRDGDGEDTILYQNFKTLIEETGATAINFDDESCYDVDAMTKFGKMCEKLGCKVTLCPYTRQNFWMSLKNNLGDNVDRIYLQCYDGGAGNNVSQWQKAFGMDIIPGYWCIHGGSGDSASSVNKKLQSDKSYITGGFMWLYDDMRSLTGDNNTASYAEAINSVNPDK